MKVLPKGRYIKHAQYGYGVITEADAERTAIDFDAYGLKKFVTSLMAVELVDESTLAPPRTRRRKKAAARAAVEAVIGRR